MLGIGFDPTPASSESTILIFFTPLYIIRNTLSNIYLQNSKSTSSKIHKQLKASTISCYQQQHLRIFITLALTSFFPSRDGMDYCDITDQMGHFHIEPCLPSFENNSAIWMFLPCYQGSGLSCFPLALFLSHHCGSFDNSGLFLNSSF